MRVSRNPKGRFMTRKVFNPVGDGVEKGRPIDVERIDSKRIDASSRRVARLTRARDVVNTIAFRMYV